MPKHLDEVLGPGFQQPGHKIFLQGPDTVSYGQLHERIEKLTTFFSLSGVHAGDTVLLAVESPAFFAELFLALFANGIGIQLVNPHLTRFEAERLIQLVCPKKLIVDEVLIKQWELEKFEHSSPVLLSVLQKETKSLLGKLLAGYEKEDSPGSRPTYPGILDSLERRKPAPNIDDAKLGYIANTSGSTSIPKSVVTSRARTAYTLSCFSKKFMLDADSRILNVLPLYHDDGLLEGPLLSFCNGATWVRPLEYRHSALPELLDAIYTYRVTHFFTVPVVLGMMLRIEEEFNDCFDLPDFQVLISTAAALSEDLWKKFETQFNMEITNNYALTEFEVGLVSGPDKDSRKVGTVGKPYGSEIKIVKDDGELAADGEAGELWFSGASIMDGYFANPQANAECMKNGWFKTGDLAARDREGFVKIVGRRKDIINFGGHVIDPMEIVEVIQSNPGVAEAAVIAVQREEWGEVPIAIVVSDKNADLSANELIEFCRERLVEYKIVRDVIFVDELPRHENGKLNNKKLSNIWTENTRITEGDVEAVVESIAQNSFRNNKPLLADDTPLTVKGWDSLAHMDLILALEKHFSVRFSAIEIMNLESFGGFVSLVKSKI